MARKNKLIATSFKGVKEVTNMNGTKDYIVTFNYKGTRFGEKNFTKLFNCTSPRAASEYMIIVKKNIDEGKNPFDTKTNTIDNLVTEYIKDKSEKAKLVDMYNYKNHVKKVIGHKFIERVTEDDLKTIRNNMKTLGLKESTIKKVKNLLSPIFNKAVAQGIITANIPKLVPMGKEQVKPRLVQRLNGSLKKNIRIIYRQTLQEEDINMRAMFLISVMCARRFNEILCIEYEDIIDGVVNVRGITTKTFKSQSEKVVERYPLPDEVLNIIGEGKGKVFRYDYQKYQKRYAKMIDEKCKLELKEVGKEYKIRSHDNRHFIMSIASEKHGSKDVGTLALSHRSINSINDIYLSFEYKRVKKLFNWYWKKLRKEQTE